MKPVDANQRDFDNKRLERSEYVLWSLTPRGMVLHHFGIRRYLELNNLGYKAWGLLDGARTVAEVVQRVAETGSATEPSAASINRLMQTLETMAVHGFIVERAGD